MQLRKTTIRHHLEETSCEECGMPLYVGDSCYFTEDGRDFCSRACHSRTLVDADYARAGARELED